ncbi:MAG: nuclear transport factor 2 family protein [Planctomycetota bacterium]|jgi:hypothetical protein
MSRTTPLVATILLAALLAGCEAAPKADAPVEATPADVRAEVLLEVERYYQDLSARNWPAFADHFWPRATMTSIWQPPGESSTRVYTSSVTEFIARAPEGPDSKEIFEERLVSAEMRVTGTMAQVWARYEAKFGDPGSIIEWSGVDAITLMKHRGRWRIVSMAYAPE